MSKRARIREKRRRDRIRRRAVSIFVVVGGALLLFFMIVYPSLIPVGEIVIPEFRERPMADGTAMGDPNAPVTIDVFEDFQCSACISFSLSVEPLLEESYIADGDVYYVFHHYPFLDNNAIGEESDQAASASMCANDQDRFWDYHDMLFANWNEENQGLIAFAEAIDLEMETFEACFEARTHYDEIMQDFDLGVQMGITGTPSVFVDGEQVTPRFVPSFVQLSEVIEAHLAALETE